MCDKPKKQADIEITPEMVEAGVSVLDDSGRLIGGLGSGEYVLVQQVFQAMARVCSPPPKPSHVVVPQPE